MSHEGLLPRQGQGIHKALARTQVYLSKTKLGNTGRVVAIYIVKVQ